ncbi:MAG: DctP family TRAP transporter solute-binding subunit [Planctomycetota bacterium]|jgi:C4-dicarboxylate-binding protein DctP|nr:DctP family TRAP transporter solute-binding subunit [Planctomycetota bacterium]
MNMNKRMLFIAPLLAAFLAAAPLQAGQIKRIKYGWAETADRKGHPVSEAAYTFKEVLEKESGGGLQVDLFPAAQLGNATSLLQQVDRGIIQACASISSGMFSSSYYDDLNFLDIPFLFKDDRVAFDLLFPTSPFFKSLADDVAANTSMRPLFFVVEGGRHLTNSKREVRVPNDMKGLKIRTMEVPAHMTMFEALGASPTPVAWTELYTALQTGVVDGQENPIFNLVYINAWEVQKYVTLDGHITLCGMTLLNKKFYDGLTDEQKKAIEAAARAAATNQFKFTSDKSESNLALLKENGMQIYQPTPEEIEAFKTITRAKVIPYLKSKMKRPELIEEVLGLVEK